MGPWEFSIQLWSMSNGPIAVLYSTPEHVGWAHGCLIINYGGRPLSPLQSNIQLRRMLAGPIGF
jgi:hypothetical protein